jgi:hypothetical protein
MIDERGDLYDRWGKLIYTREYRLVWLMQNPEYLDFNPDHIDILILQLNPKLMDGHGDPELL